MPGVRTAEVSFAKKEAVVQATTCDTDAMFRAVQDIGYRAHLK